MGSKCLPNKESSSDKTLSRSINANSSYCLRMTVMWKTILPSLRPFITRVIKYQDMLGYYIYIYIEGLPWWLSDKESAYNAGDMDSVPGLGRSLGEGNGNPLQYSCLGNSMDREKAWQPIDYEVAKVSAMT